MGGCCCGGKQVRWYIPGGHLPDSYLTVTERAVLRQAWDHFEEQRLGPADRFRRMAEELKCPQHDVTYLHQVLDSKRLGFDDTCKLIGVLLYGTPEHRKRLYFDSIDKDGSGSLDLHELEHVLKLTAHQERHPSRRDVKDPKYFKKAAKEIMRVADEDKSGLVDFPEFMKAYDEIQHTLNMLATKAARLNTNLRGGSSMHEQEKVLPKVAKTAWAGNIRPNPEGHGSVASERAAKEQRAAKAEEMLAAATPAPSEAPTIKSEQPMRSALKGSKGKEPSSQKDAARRRQSAGVVDPKAAAPEKVTPRVSISSTDGLREQRVSIQVPEAGGQGVSPMQMRRGTAASGP